MTLREGVRELGLDPDDSDWARIDWDWVRPADTEAWRRDSHSAGLSRFLICSHTSSLRLISFSNPLSFGV